MHCPEQEVGNVPRFDNDPTLHLASSGISETRGMEGYFFQEDSDQISGSVLLKVHKGCERLIKLVRLRVKTAGIGGSQNPACEL